MARLLHRILEPQPAGPSPGGLPVPEQARHGTRRNPLLAALTAVRRAPELGGLIGVSALLNLWALGQNQWANTYYSAAVRSMASSWHNFLYASADPSGIQTVDKPPLSLWVQALSVRVFGFHPLAILVPQALMGVAAVVITYDLVRRRFGRLGGAVAGLVLATTPIAVAMSRHNNPDELLTLLGVAAVWFAVRALEDGRTRWLVFAGVAVGLAFETKFLVALVAVPGIALAWIYVAPRGRLRALRQLLAGGAAMLVAGGAWPLLVMLTPAGSRPYISGTADNSILSLIFGYDGFGRVTGQAGGPAAVGGGASTTFGGGTGIFRLFNFALGGQAGWLLGAAVVGAVVLALATRARRMDPRTHWLLAVGITFVTIALLFSFADGIFHPYYVVALAPFTAALVGAGVGTVVQRGLGAALGASALLAAGVIGEFVVLGQYAGQLRWLEVVLPIACGLAAIVFFLTDSRRGRAFAASVGVGVLMIGPAIWAVDTLTYETPSTFPSGGPQTLTSTSAASNPFGASAFPGGRGLFGGRGAPGAPGAGGGGFPQFGGGFGGEDSSLTAIVQYVDTHGGGTIAVSSQSSAATPIISSDAHVAGIGGFTGQESDPSIAWLASEVAAGRIRWVLDDGSGAPRFTGGSPSLFGGGSRFGRPAGGIGGRPGASAALGAAARACTAVQTGAGTLYDCAGRAAALRALS
jgi:4-amino-4-deoxy-L-arabinose transferase-like glycosyltransferase